MKPVHTRIAPRDKIRTKVLTPLMIFTFRENHYWTLLYSFIGDRTNTLSPFYPFFYFLHSSLMCSMSRFQV